MISPAKIEFKALCKPYGLKLQSADCSKVRKPKFKHNSHFYDQHKALSRDLCEGCPGPVPINNATGSEIIEEKGNKTMNKPKPCRGCGRNLPIVGRDLCGRCYRYESQGRPIPPLKTSECRVEGCKNLSTNSNGYCGSCMAGINKACRESRVILDFRDRLDVLAQIQEFAKRNLRTLEMQTLWFLLKGMEREKE